ncbi:MAG: porin family protein [Dysgonomonas sp.]
MKTVFKSLILVYLLISTVFQIQAQSDRKRFTSDFHVGLNFANMDISRGGNNDFNEPKLGATLGMNFNYKIFHNIQIQSGFFVTKKGLKQSIHKEVIEPLNDITVTDTLNHTVANYMQVPLCLGYEVYFTDKFGFNLNAGGYIAYGYKGTYENKYYMETIFADNTVISNPLEIVNGQTFDLNKWKRWDYGFIGSVGFIYDIFMLNFNYEHGLHDLSSTNTVSMKNRTLSVSLGFRF